MKKSILKLPNKIYAQFYLTKDESEDEYIMEEINKYKSENYNVGIFISGSENYSNILKNIINKELEISRNT